MVPVSKLLLAPNPLVGCVFAAVWRDTRGVDLSDADRVSHFPASPLVSLTLVIHGELQVAAGDAPRCDVWVAAPGSFVMGPQNAPVTSWAAGEVTAVSIGFYHDAWLRLGGDPNFQEVPESLATALKALGSSDQPESGWSAFCAALSPVWAAIRPSDWLAATGIADWARAAVTRAILPPAGNSIRSIERRIRRLSGQSKRTLEFFATFEELHRLSRRQAGRSLAGLAQEAGYADQSHMGRAVRRASGFSPARLNAAIENEEPFWCYRLFGERF